MKGKHRRVPRGSRCFHTLLFTIAASLLGCIGQSWAACDGLGGQCVVTDGSTVNFTGGIYETTGIAPAQTALYASDNSTIKMTGGEVRLNPPTLTGGYAAWAKDSGTIHFDNTKITGWGGVYVDNALFELGDKSTIAITGDNINALTLVNGSNTLYTYNAINTFSTSGTNSHGLLSEGLGNNIYLHTAKINTSGNASHGIFVKDQAYYTDIYGAADISTQGTGSHGILAMNGADVAIFEETHIQTQGDNSVGVYLVNDGHLYTFDETQIETRGAASHAIVLAGDSSTQIGDYYAVKESFITTHGIGAYAVLFEEIPGTSYQNEISLTKTSLQSLQSSAIMAKSSIMNNIVDLWDSKVTGADWLVEVRDTASGDPTRLEIRANNSSLFGGAALDSPSHLRMQLRDNSEWTLRHDASGNGLSEVSILELNNSRIRFDAPFNGIYQTLRVGAGNPGTNTVYNASGNASVTLNTFLNEGGAWSNQFTDRLLIEGDVSGQTTLFINEMPGSTGGQTSPGGTNLAQEGISLVQVSGIAAENSFALDGGYVTMGGLPYTYKLYAYGPGSSHGAADSGQKQVSGTNHWDYRLQSECIGPCPPPQTQPPALQVAPQLANYLVAPTALFHAGLQELGSLHQRLGDGRATNAHLSRAGKGEFFLRGLGGDYRYLSNLAPTRYGYDADITHTAMQGGGDIYGLQTDNNEIRFGLAGSYGDLAFTPQRSGSRKTRMNVWNATPYMTWQHESGAYLDAVFSYGSFGGQVSTKARGRTASLQGKRLAASIETGMPFSLPSTGVTLEPQVQVVYQKLKFDATQDIDNFAVRLGAPRQWTLKAGAELSKRFSQSPIGQSGKLYGKLALVHSLTERHQAWFGDTFEVGRAGTHLHTEAGIQLALGKNANFYSDVTWQTPIGGVGTRGVSVNAGFNLRF